MSFDNKKGMHWYYNIKKRVDRRDPKKPTELIQAIFENSKSPVGNAFQTWKLNRNWPDVVGKNIAANSRPKNFYRGTFFIAVKNSVWMQELSFMSGPIKDKINRAVGWEWAKKIIFTLEDSKSESNGAATEEQNARGSRGFLSK